MKHLKTVSKPLAVQRPAMAWSLLELEQIANVLILFTEAVGGAVAIILTWAEATGKLEE